MGSGQREFTAPHLVNVILDRARESLQHHTWLDAVCLVRCRLDWAKESLQYNTTLEFSKDRDATVRLGQTRCNPTLVLLCAKFEIIKY